MPPEARLPSGGLYAITPALADTARLVAAVEACLAGGAAVVQYRAKEAAPALALEQARALAAVCRRAGVPLIVNDGVLLAREAGASGVHLGRDDGDVAAARATFPGAIVGLSCYDDPQRAARAAAQGADYVAIGSVFASATKPQAVRAPLERLAQARAASGLPVVAIGGVNADNAGRAIAAGADFVAVIDALFGAPDIERAARALANAIQEARPEHARP